MFFIIEYIFEINIVDYVIKDFFYMFFDIKFCI